MKRCFPHRRCPTNTAREADHCGQWKTLLAGRQGSRLPGPALSPSAEDTGEKSFSRHVAVTGDIGLKELCVINNTSNDEMRIITIAMREAKNQC